MRILKKIAKWLGIILLVLLVGVGTIYFIYLRPFMQKMKQIQVTTYDKSLTLMTGGGGNTGIVSSDSLVIVIDSKMDDAAEELYKTVQKLAGKRPLLVVNTHYHPDHSKGNLYYKGARILAGGNYSKDFWKKEASEETMPTDWLKDRMDIKMGEDTVTILNLAKNIHTASDIVVYLHKRKMLFGGDVLLNKQVPVIMGVADPKGYLAVLDSLPKWFDIKTIVPGHGPVGGIEIITDFKQYFQDMKMAAADDSKKDELVAKYKNWSQIPMLMSPEATIRAIRKKTGK